MENKQNILTGDKIFDGFMEPKALFLHCFGKMPCITWVGNIDKTNVLKFIEQKHADKIESIYQNSEYDRKKKQSSFSMAILKLSNTCIIELTDNYCEILHTKENDQFADELIKAISVFKAKQKKKAFEINIIVKDSYGLELKSMEIKKTKLDLNLYYEDDFLEVDKIIQNRLCKKNDKGIVLLHGLPGTGKTTYLRYLIGKLKKKAMFVSPGMAATIMNPEFIDFLIDNPNSILIIEDAENIIMDRRMGGDSCVSNLLNISDGLLADFLNVQVICTFNNALSTVDSALLRKGRLIAKYEFGKLSVDKSQKLSNHLEFDKIINQPMTIAEITNPQDKEHKADIVQVMGFRRELMAN
jgi:SpoVK/Ycf46/Vps4 family AAA+-type ATPase